MVFFKIDCSKVVDLPVDANHGAPQRKQEREAGVRLTHSVHTTSKSTATMQPAERMRPLPLPHTQDLEQLIDFNYILLIDYNDISL